MTTEAPTPAPNRRADDTIDPKYKKPLAPPPHRVSIPTHKDFANATALLETLTSDTVVKRFSGSTKVGVKHPLDDHFYVCFSIPDAAPPCDVFTEYLEPAIRKMAAMLYGVPAIAVQQLTLCPAGMVLCYNFPDSVLPLRFIVCYDGVREEHSVTVELYCRRIDIREGMRIYFLRKKGTTDQYYQRRGGRKRWCDDQLVRDPKWGLMATAACWTSPNGPRPVKGSDGETVPFQLGEEITG